MAAETTPPSGGDATAAFQRYLLDRLGLLPDEIDWPSKTDAGEIDGASADVRASTTGGVGGSAWRARDPLSSLLGDDARVTSEGGATPLETSMQELAEGDKSNSAATPELISLASILDPLLPNKPYPTPNSLDVNVAKKAFDAAALAVVRGTRRSPEASTAEGSVAVDPSEETAAPPPSHGYEPPLLRAAEAIRTSRRECLDAASNAPSVPQFLKKNNTIPWFHVPLVARGGRNGSGSGEGGRAGTPSSLAGSPDRVGSAVVAVKKEGDGEAGPMPVKSVIKKEGSTKRSGEASPGDVGASTVKRPKLDDDDTVHPHISKNKSPAAGKTPKGSDKKRARSKILTPSSSAILTPSSAASKPLPSPEAGRKKKLATVRTPSSVEDAMRLSGNAATARAIIGAATSGMFRELDPEREANKVSDDEAGRREAATLAGIASSTTANAANTVVGKKKGGQVEKKEAAVNVADVLARAKKMGDGAADKARGTARRGDQRREFRGNGARARSTLGGGEDGAKEKGEEARGGAAASPFLVRPAHSLPLAVPNPFVTAAGNAGNSAAMDVDTPNNRSSAAAHPPAPSTTPTDPEWTQSCRPRLLSILGAGAGHAVWHDRQWDGRAARAADLLRHLAVARGALGGANGASTKGYPNYGPHLVVTAAADLDKFASAFARLDEGLAVVAKTDEADEASAIPANADGVLLRALPYRGPPSHRRRLRKHFGSLMPPPQSPAAFLSGLPDSPFHVILTTYTALTEDFGHFSQIPFQCVILDEGLGWLGCAGSDPAGALGKAWHDALWNASDAADGALEGGKVAAPWDFGKDVANGAELDITECEQPRPRRGLTARHRLLLASAMHARHKDQIYRAPVLGLLSFLSPPLADAVKDEWERSRVFGCQKTMAYLRSAVARAIVVYAGDATVRPPEELVALAVRALEGALPSRFPCDLGREDGGVDALVQARKIGHSRKHAAAWFRPSSAMRSEVAAMKLDPLLATAKKLNGQGHCCEEMVTTSSLTPAGIGGAVLGLSAYRPAVRCGRVFSSEQGLKQHIMSVHAPPGTWLCRYCAGDCGTSQARASHERTCGSLQGGGSAAGSKKKDGHRRVTGYKGVWVRPDKKHFVKVDGQPVKGDGDAPLLFDSAEAAATKFDEVMADKRDAQESEPNYTSDSSGGAAVDDDDDDDDAPPAAKVAKKTGHGTVINYTVPALAEIDIKNLPPHIKPLLRDPAWTPRTQGSKRYVYAYRGVCRQQRKGHDRWQSQISCDGTNHYLGTFDSEWDAAACYAWAHLILYGEEATEKARLEGEEAVAAYERQQRDVAEGKSPPPEPKKKKARRSTPKKGIVAVAEAAASGGTPKGDLNVESRWEAKARSPNNADLQPPSSVQKKKAKTMSLKQWGKLKTDVAFMLSSGTKGTSKTTLLTTRKDIADMSERLLLHHVSGHFLSASDNFLQSIQTVGRKFKLPACVPLSRFAPPLRGERSRALLIGLPSGEFGWEVEKFIAACAKAGAAEAAGAFATLSVEFGAAGANKSFRALLLSKSCTLGRASRPSPINLSPSSAQAESTLGMPVGSLDCNVGGPEHSCSERAAKIEYLPSAHSNFQFMACNDDDIVTLNGQRVSAKSGPLPLKHRDICGVGARVFVFIEKTA